MIKFLSLPISFNRQRRRRAGFSLVEMAIVMGVIGAIIGAIWFPASMVREKARVSTAVDQLNLVAQNMTSVLQSGYGMSGSIAAGANLTAAMIANKAIPQWSVTSGSTTTAGQPWSPTGFAIFWMGSNPRKYRMSFYGVSLQGCIGLLTQTTVCQPGQPGCPIGGVTNFGACGANCAFNTYTTGMTASQVQALCNQNSYTSLNNSVEFDFVN
jgi:type II secretory pathway pseudopilin PulG